MAETENLNKCKEVFLGKTGLKVTNICLGTMTFGKSSWMGPGQLDENSSHEIINRYVQWGGNFLDTADVYAVGESEEIVGKYLERQKRDKFVVATKAGFGMGTGENKNNIGLSRRHLTDSIDNSLKRLHTDYVDLYQAHCWDTGVRLEETLRTLDDFVRCGKVTYVGVSNYTGWQLQKLVDMSEKLGLNPIAGLQQQYNLLCRDCEFEPFQVCKENGIGVLPWSPLKGGLLTGKVKRGVKPTEGRLGWVAENEKRKVPVTPAYSGLSEKTFDVIEKVESIAKEKGRTIPQVAVRWLLQKDVVTSVIVGAKTVKQLDDNMGAASGWTLSEKEMQELDAISEPTPSYPYDFIKLMNGARQNPAFDYQVRSQQTS